MSEAQGVTWRRGPTVAGPDGVDIATWDLGGAGPPLLLVHGTGFHARVWLAAAPPLRDRFHVWAIDQRGHGASGHAPGGDHRDWGRFADDLLAVTAALGLSAAAGAVAAGHSLGGAVALLAEQRRPGRFAAISCWEPILPPPDDRRPEDGVDMSRMTRKRRAGFASRDEARSNYAGKPPFSTWAPQVLDDYVAHGFVDGPGGGVLLACRPEEESSVYEGARLHRGWEHLVEVAVPVTVRAGDAGGTASLHAEGIAAHLPAGRFRRCAGLSHFGPMEDPVRVGRMIAGDLGGTRPGPGRPSA